MEDSCKGEEEEEGKEIYAKLSVIPVTKRGNLVATAPSIHGTGRLVNGIKVNH